MKFTYQRFGVEGKFEADTIHQLVSNAAKWPQTTLDHLQLYMELQLQILINLEDGHSPLHALVLAVNSILGLTIILITNGDRKLFQQ